MKLKIVLIAVLAGLTLWAQVITPSATIAQDPATGVITAVVSTSRTNRLVCKYIPLPVSGPYTKLNVNCTLDSKPYQVYFVQFNSPFQAGLDGITLGINAHKNMAITALLTPQLATFKPMAAVAPGTTGQLLYQIVANGVLKQGQF